jgi:uncharacterized protein (TIGR03032 family)
LSPTGPSGTGRSAPESDRSGEARFHHSPAFAATLRGLGCTLLVSTYQAGKLIAVGPATDGLRFELCGFDQAMGVAVNRDTLAVGARGQIWFLRNNAQIAPMLEPRGTYDRAYLPRTVAVTGAIQCHELAWGAGGDGNPDLWVVNTLFSCLAGLDPEYSFVPRWRPPFVSRLAGEDRCHLNGLGMRDGRPAFVTVMAQTDEATGWRADKNHGGCVLEVPGGETVTRGLSMPHSPRWHRGRLLVLNSGHGTLEAVDSHSGARVVVERFPGFTRGLACVGDFAFVGLSRIREKAVFGGLPIAERHAELRCGVAIVDLRRGATTATLEFESGIEEIFDVQVLPDAGGVALGGGERGDGRPGGEIWVVPPEGPGKPIPASTRSVDADALVTQALEAQTSGQSARALDLLRRAAQARPQSAEIVNHLGNALQDVGEQEQALDAYRRAADADPGFAPARQNLGYLLVAHGSTDEGIAELEHAQRIAPRDINRVLITNALPIIYPSTEDASHRRRRQEAAVQELVDDGVHIDTEATLVPTNFFAAYQGLDDRRLHENLGRVFVGRDLTPTGTARHRERPRIGFISAYFRDHTIGRLNLGRVQHLDPERFETVVLSASTSHDPIAQAYEQAAERFVHLPRDPATARRMVAEQQLDLLFFTDVGMDALTYTLAFSRMAAVQCVTWGHPVTTGSPAIDYFLSSALLEMPAAGAHYTEQLVLPPSLCTYYHRPGRPAELDGARARLGLSPDTHVYACPQTLFKLHPEFDPLLAAILRGDPDGELVLIQGRSSAWTEQLAERLRRTMPDVVDRIRWLAPLPRPAFLELLAVSDVLLDPITFGGGNTSYEALAMGTPVVTLPGELLRTRITQALYAKAGYTDLVVGSAEAYVDASLRLGTDPVARAQARARIRETSSGLFEDAQEVRDLETVLAQMLAGAPSTGARPRDPAVRATPRDS